jgi:hypothetical protein
VFVNLLDPQGQPCATPHPAVLLQRTEVIANATTLWVAGISSAFTEPLPDGWFKVPYRAKPQKPHPVTELWKPCVLKCDWRQPISRADILEEFGQLPQQTLLAAMAWIKADVERLKREHGS